MSCSLQMTSLMRLSTRGRAMLLGTGVTRPTQWLYKDGVNSGSAATRRGLRLAILAYAAIICR